uniref:Uncharacterized protein n=1 Tax=Cacopsylla melanoneura TaxID=428564 RepID=A0A8D8WH71_9HEMI
MICGSVVIQNRCIRYENIQASILELLYSLCHGIDFEALHVFPKQLICPVYVILRSGGFGSCYPLRQKTSIILISNTGHEKQSRNESSNVGCVGSHEYHGEPSPDVDEKLVGPRFGRFVLHEVTAQETPHCPQSRRHREVFTPLSPPRI